MKRLVSLSLLLLPVLLMAAEPSPAATIAAKVIRERAADIERGGQLAVAEELRVLADHLAGGKVTLADAALVMQIATAGNARPTTPPPTAEQRKAAEKAAAKVASVLDAEPPAPVAYQPAPGPESAPATPVPATPAPATPPIDEKALAIPVATTVLIADWVGEPKSLLVMIGVGKNQHVSPGQRFVVKRGEQQLAVISATQVKETSTICMAVAGTLADGVQIKPGDAVVSE